MTIKIIEYFKRSKEKQSSDSYKSHGMNLGQPKEEPANANTLLIRHLKHM